MGSSASKQASAAGRAAKKSVRYDTKPSEFVPKRTNDPPMNPDSVAPRVSQAAGQAQRQAQFSDSRDSTIEADSADPSLDANLRILGQVKVQRPASQFQPADQMVHIMKKREAEAEEDEIDPMILSKRKNVLSSPLLVSLLDERKDVKSQAELQELADRYNVDMSVLDQLGEFFNSPSVLQRTAEDVKRDVMHSVWVDPQVKAQSG